MGTSKSIVVPAEAGTQSVPRFEKYGGLDSSLRWNDVVLGLTECHDPNGLAGYSCVGGVVDGRVINVDGRRYR